MYKYLFYSFLFIIFFSIFIELYVGGISIRKNDLNFHTFYPKNMFYYLINPLYNSFLWNPSILHCNFIVMFFIFSFIYYKVLRYHLNKFEKFKKISKKWILLKNGQLSGKKEM